MKAKSKHSSIPSMKVEGKVALVTGAGTGLGKSIALALVEARAAYCSSKAGVVNLTRVLAIEWAPYHINVNAVAPTFMLTPLTEKLFKDRNFSREVLRRIPLGRLGTPEDVASAVVFLASPAADLITGHTLLVD